MNIAFVSIKKDHHATPKPYNKNHLHISQHKSKSQSAACGPTSAATHTLAHSHMQLQAFSAATALQTARPPTQPAAAAAPPNFPNEPYPPIILPSSHLRSVIPLSPPSVSLSYRRCRLVMPSLRSSLTSRGSLWWSPLTTAPTPLLSDAEAAAAAPPPLPLLTGAPALLLLLEP